LNNARKDKGFEVSDRVRIAWVCDDDLVAQALEEHAELVAREVLATDFGPLDGNSGDEEIELGGAILLYTIERDD